MGTLTVLWLLFASIFCCYVAHCYQITSGDNKFQRKFGVLPLRSSLIDVEPVNISQPVATIKGNTGPLAPLYAISSAWISQNSSIFDGNVFPTGSSNLMRSSRRQYVNIPGMTNVMSMVTIPVSDPSDIDTLANRPTQMGVLSKIIANNPGLLPGFVQMDVCTYELLEICTPQPGTSFCSPEQCYGRCMSTPACRRVTFTPDGLCQMETRNCQNDVLLSSGNSFLRVSPVYAAFPGNCPDDFLTDNSFTDDKRVGCTRCSIAECRAACDMLPDCAGFSYADPSTPLEPNNRQCYIKSDVCSNPVPGTHIFYLKLALYM